MFSLLSIIVGLIGLALGVLALIPFLGWAYWMIVPIAVVGLVLALIGGSGTGKALNGIVIVIGIARLFLGGGFI